MVCSETTQTELEAGTWTNYGSTPDIYLEGDEIKAGEGTNYIVLGDDTEDITRSSDGSRIYANQTCSLKVFATTTTKRDNLVSDIENIFVASGEALSLEDNSSFATGKRKRLIKEYTVNLTTTS